MPKFRDLRRALRNHDRRFEIREQQGKGSHRIIFHPDVDGRPEKYPVPFHGNNTDLKPGWISGLRRRFGLPDDFLR